MNEKLNKQLDREPVGQAIHEEIAQRMTRSGRDRPHHRCSHATIVRTRGWHLGAHEGTKDKDEKEAQKKPAILPSGRMRLSHQG